MTSAPTSARHTPIGDAAWEAIVRRLTSPPTPRRNRFIATCSGLTIGGVAYFLTLLDFSRSITRTAIAPGYFSHFFDLQGRALLNGHLYVPDNSLGIEGFIHGGHTYMYFPPWPAILRLPILMTTHEYDARLTVLSMSVAWIVLAIVVTKLIWLLMALLSGSDEVTRIQALLGALFLATATGGTFLTYDASLPWVYHEVYIWAVVSAIGALYWMIRVLVRPDPHSVKWLFVFALLAVGSRATEGWAICLVVIAIAIFQRSRPTSGEHRRLWWRIVLAGAVPLGISILINELKFDTVFMFPLQDQVWTQISQQRRDALAANGGSLTGPQFFTTSFMAYLRPDGIRFVDYFPWITLPAHAAPAYDGAVVDQTYRTGSATAFMPVFMLMELVAVAAVLRPGDSGVLRRLRWPMFAAVLITGGVMGYGYYSTRYTSDFVPALVLGSAVTTCLLAQYLEPRPRWRVPVYAVLVTGAAFSILAQMAVGVSTSAFIHRGDTLVRYVGWQHAINPARQAQLVSHIDGLPTGGDTDDLAISGNCDALYVNTGDKYEPWLPVQVRDQVLRLSYDATGLQSGQARLLTVKTDHEDSLDIQVNNHRQVRFLVNQGGKTTTLDWFDPPTEGGLGVGIRNRIDFSSYEFDSSASGVIGYLPSFFLNDKQDSLPSLLTVSDDQASLRDLGLEMNIEPGLPLTLCNQLADTAKLDLAGH